MSEDLSKLSWEEYWARMAVALAAAGVPPTKRVEIALNQQAARSSGAAPLQSANKEEPEPPKPQPHAVVTVLSELPATVIQPLMVDVELLMDLFFTIDKDSNGTLSKKEFDICKHLMEEESAADVSAAGHFDTKHDVSDPAAPPLIRKPRDETQLPN